MPSHYMVRTKKKTLVVTHQSPRSLNKYEIIWTGGNRQGHLQCSRTTTSTLQAAARIARYAVAITRVVAALQESGWAS